MFQLTNPLVARLRLVVAGAVVAVLLSCQNLQNQWPHLLLHIMHFIFHFILRRICLFVACLNRFLALFVLKSYFYFCISTYAHLQLLSENDWYFIMILVLTYRNLFEIVGLQRLICKSFPRWLEQYILTGKVQINF